MKLFHFDFGKIAILGMMGRQINIELPHRGEWRDIQLNIDNMLGSLFGRGGYLQGEIADKFTLTGIRSEEIINILFNPL